MANRSSMHGVGGCPLPKLGLPLRVELAPRPVETPTPWFVSSDRSFPPSGPPSGRGPTCAMRTSRCGSNWPRCVSKPSVKRPRVRFADRLFWVWLHRFWGRWREALILVQPETVLRWHRRGFKKSRTWRSRRRGLGRPRIDRKVKELIERIATANPLWGAPRVHAELLELGTTTSQRTVSRWMPRREKQTGYSRRAAIAAGRGEQDPLANEAKGDPAGVGQSHVAPAWLADD